MRVENLRLAVLIDGDNAPRDSIKKIIEEIAIYGTPIIKRIYGDWASQNLTGWKNELLENAVIPKQQFAYTSGKNATDSAMIIDAMDLLYAGRTDGFVLVSSDSDFTPLATRLREGGMYVIGIGEKKTPKAFVNSCDKFIHVENIGKPLDAQEPVVKPAAKTTKTAASKTAKAPAKTADKAAKTPAKAAAVKKPEEKKVAVPDSVIELIADSIADLAEDDGFIDMSNLGNLIIKKQPDFDPRTYGFGKLSTMLRALPRFELDVRPTSDPHVKPMYIRDTEAQ